MSTMSFGVCYSQTFYDNCVFCVEYAIIRLKLELRQNRVSEIGSEWRESLNGIANEKLNPNESNDLKPVPENRPRLVVFPGVNLFFASSCCFC